MIIKETDSYIYERFWSMPAFPDYITYRWTSKVSNEVGYIKIPNYFKGYVVFEYYRNQQQITDINVTSDEFAAYFIAEYFENLP